MNTLIPILMMLMTLISISLFAQEDRCGQNAREDYMKIQIPDYSKFSRSVMKQKNKPGEYRTATSELIPLNVYILTLDDGTGGISECDLLTSIDQLNENFINTSYMFHISNINYLNSSYYYNVTSYEEADALYADYNVQDAINIYFVKTAVTSCGFANFPWSNDRYIVMKNSCSTNTSTFGHEMGHYLGLLHTHDTTYGAELVERVDCENTGDLLCDTEADPNLAGEVYSNCQYIGNETDDNGIPYIPSTVNMMSYSKKHCRFNFTTDQIDRMDYFYDTVRDAQLGSESEDTSVSCPCLDIDEDGFCSNNDPDDFDACVPVLGSDCADCISFTSNSFEGYDMGIWNDGGSDCIVYKSSSYASAGSYSVRIRDNSGIRSSVYTDLLDFEEVNEATLNFSFKAKSMENGEKFNLQVSTDGGEQFSIIKVWERGVDFENNLRYKDTLEIASDYMTDSLIFRFECDASANYDMIFLDEINIITCGGEPSILEYSDTTEDQLFTSASHGLSPEETSQVRNEPEISQLSVFDMFGNALFSTEEVDAQDVESILRSLPNMLPQIVVVVVHYENGEQRTKKLFTGI
jgi:hypothetical protein